MPSFSFYTQQNPDNIDVLNSQKFNYGTTPKNSVVEQNQTYMAYFDGVGGTGPEYIDGTGYFIKYLIDTQGNIVNPEPFEVGDNPQAVPLYNLIDNFEIGKRAIVKLISTNPIYDTSPNSEILTGIHNIAHVGKIIPIIMSETGYNINDYALTLDFLGSNNTNVVVPPSSPSFLFSANKDSNQSLASANTPEIIDATEEVVTNDQYNNTTSEYTFDYNTSDYSNRVNFRVRGRIKFGFGDLPFNDESYSNISVDIRKNSPTGPILATAGVNLTWNGSLSNKNQNFDFDIETGLQNFNTNDVIAVYAYYDTDSNGATCNVQASNYLFSNTSEYISSSAGGGVAPPYWTVGTYLTGSNITTLTSSLGLFQNYGSDFIQSQSQAMLTYGFSKILSPFQLQKGDFIRFEYNPDKVFTITNIKTEDRVYIDVIPPIPTGSILDHFTIYRVVNDGAYVTLDVKKDIPGGAYTGILIPEFASEDLIKNYDKIITDLTLKEIIN